MEQRHETAGRAGEAIPEQAPVAWVTALVVSWAGLKRRLLRSTITMSGVVLAIAFLAYMLITESIVGALVTASADDAKLNLILQKAGVDVLTGRTDKMMILLLGLSLVTCTVGIVNSMLMSVTERVREIGTLKCLGARDSFIVKTYLIEASIHGIFGSLVGMAAGGAVAFAVAFRTYQMYVITLFPVGAVLSALALSLLCGSLMSVVAAIAPAYMAAKKQPVEALRVEE